MRLMLGFPLQKAQLESLLFSGEAQEEPSALEDLHSLTDVESTSEASEVRLCDRIAKRECYIGFMEQAHYFYF